MPDLLIRGAEVVLETSVQTLDVSVTNGKICGLFAPGTGPEASRRLDADGLWLMPGAIDAHTHFTACGPDRAEEVFAGTCGAAVGGVTTVIEMPHGLPPALDVSSLEAKRALMDDNAAVDFALWAGLTGKNADQIPAMARAGAVAFKGFLCSPRLDGAAPDETALPALGDGELLGAMRAVKSAGSLIGIHAENQDILLSARERLIAAGRLDMKAHAESGPELAEIEAVNRLALYAAETGAPTHVVHLSSSKAASILARARAEGTNISVETCLHYLCLTEDDLIRIGNVARCGPPLRPAEVASALWLDVMSGKIDMFASDHCPYPPEMKADGLSVWDAGMGLTGIETNVPLALSEGVIKRGMSLVEFVQMTATAPAKRFGLSHCKGSIRVGADADLTLWDPSGRQTIRGATFHGRARFSAFDGWEVAGRLQETLLRGRTVYLNGKASPDRGQGQQIRRH